MNQKIYLQEQVQEKEVKENLNTKQFDYIISFIEIGVPVILSASEEKAAQKTITQYGFNMVASDKISMDRRIKDTRPEEYDFSKKII
jgi:hypothetical protein